MLIKEQKDHNEAVAAQACPYVSQNHSYQSACFPCISRVSKSHCNCEERVPREKKEICKIAEIYDSNETLSLGVAFLANVTLDQTAYAKGCLEGRLRLKTFE